MPYTVEQLFKDRESFIPPTGIQQSASIEEALNVMLKKQFSQLPVVDNDNRLIGETTAHMVTNESILRAWRNLKAVPARLRVSEAMVRVRPYRLDDQLFDLLRDLRDTYAVPIMGDKRQLVGVVTSYDTTEYFRKRAEDMMHIERIEKILREYVKLYFTDPSGELNEDVLNAAISDITPSNQKELRGPFKQALKYYLELLGDTSSSIKNELAEEAFERYLYRKEPAKAFDKLTLDDYIRLFVQEERWKRYSRFFLRESKEMQKLLEDIRDIRNALAHFRIETITDEQRDKILYYEEWLESFYTDIVKEFLPSPLSENADDMEPANIPPIHTEPKADSASIEVLQLEEEKPSDSRYAPLAVWLQEQPSSERAIKLTFQQIEAIIGDKLPESSPERSWWANDSVGHVQSQQWLEVGWRVSNINITEEMIVFTRIKDREKLYIDFYSKLLSKLSKVARFHLRQASPDGLSWMIISRMPGGSAQTAFLGFSFARRERFRVELYIDSGDREKNKLLFDALHKRESEIRSGLADVHGSLEWERIDEKRASRVAIYYESTISIISKESELAALREWAVDAVIKFQQVMQHHVSEIMSEVI